MVAVGDGDPAVVVATLRQALEALTRLSAERAGLEEALKVCSVVAHVQYWVELQVASSKPWRRPLCAATYLACNGRGPRQQGRTGPAGTYLLSR